MKLSYLFIIITVGILGRSIIPGVQAYDPAVDVSSGAHVRKNITHPLYRESQGSYDLYISSGTYLFVLHTGLQIERNEKGMQARTIQSQNNFNLVMNAGYFTYHKDTNTFKPAGRIVDGLTVIRSMVKEFWSKGLDKNLAVTITYLKKTNTIELSRNDIAVPKEGIYAFSAGPQIIQSGKVMSGITAPISHRQRHTTRTFLIVDKDGNPHLGATIQGYTLPDLAKKIQEMKVFYGQYHVVNLDGGSSTSFAAGTRYWNSRARLPWFFGDEIDYITLDFAVAHQRYLLLLYRNHQDMDLYGFDQFH